MGPLGLPRANLGPLWDQLGPPWNHLGTNLGPTSGQFGLTWATLGHLGANLGYLGLSGSNLSQLAAKFGPSWATLGAILGQFRLPKRQKSWLAPRQGKREERSKEKKRKECPPVISGSLPVAGSGASETLGDQSKTGGAPPQGRVQAYKTAKSAVRNHSSKSPSGPLQARCAKVLRLSGRFWGASPTGDPATEPSRAH